MDCREARRAMDDLLDGALMDSEALDEHAAACGECRGELGRLRALDAAVAASVAYAPEEHGLERMTAEVLDEIEVRRPVALWAKVTALAAAAVVIFCGGLWSGRAAWPTERVVERVVEVPKVVEKLVPVTVVEEREVVREVPVVRTRVVYRDRVVRVDATGQAPRRHAEEPVKAEEVVRDLGRVELVDAMPMPVRIGAEGT
ncbi:MAG: hypothetical protein ISS72_10630 [Candidatus Brocadiae bacterium]|nr:hypothetical protein [Candidatus Brocadiia bacterium]